jgi:uncharacterized membrane protein YdjX (TVP38/TMEM64 family)
MTEQPPEEQSPETAPEADTPVSEDEAPGLGEIFRRLGPAGYLAIAWMAVPILGSILLWLNMGAIGDWLRENQQTGLVIYIAIFVFSAGFGLLPTYVQAILGGWAFGVAWGFPAAVAGVTGAAMVGYIAARMASEDRAERLIAENPKARAVADSLIGHGFWKTLGIVTLLRVPLNSPFAITNLVMASAGVPKRAFVIGTAVGMAPRTGLAVYLAAGVQELSKSAVSEAGPPWLKIAAIASGIIVLGIVIWMGNRAVKKVTQAEASA